jgi:hypothetical protein
LGTITENTPVALRTRRCRQKTGPTDSNDGEGGLFQATDQERNKDKELIRQLRTNIKEQDNSISEVSSAVESVLKIQAVVKKLQGNISKISKQVVPQERFKVTVSKIGLETIIPFTPPLETFVGMTKRQIFMKEWQDSAESRLKKLNESDPFNLFQEIQHATLVKKSKVTLIRFGSISDSQSDHDQSDNEQGDCSPTKSDLDSSQDDSSDNSGAEPETPPVNSRNHGNRFKHRRDIPEDLQVSNSESSPPPSIENHKVNRYLVDVLKDKSQGYKKKDSFVQDRAPWAEHIAAHAR